MSYPHPNLCSVQVPPGPDPKIAWNGGVSREVFDSMLVDTAWARFGHGICFPLHLLATVHRSISGSDAWMRKVSISQRLQPTWKPGAQLAECVCERDAAIFCHWILRGKPPRLGSTPCRHSTYGRCNFGNAIARLSSNGYRPWITIDMRRIRGYLISSYVGLTGLYLSARIGSKW
jgi:hypothetical protein